MSRRVRGRHVQGPKICGTAYGLGCESNEEICHTKRSLEKSHLTAILLKRDMGTSTTSYSFPMRRAGSTSILWLMVNMSREGNKGRVSLSGVRRWTPVVCWG